jgi:L-threonylcarbamoyladenylate synthase
MLYPELVASINNKTLISPFAFPTETVFGIFAPFNRYDLITKIYEIKKRSYDKKLLMMFNSFNELGKYYYLNDYRKSMIKKYSPGKVSFVCELLDGVNPHPQTYEEKDGKKWSGFRITNFKPLSKLLNEINMPLVQSSLSISNELQITDSSNISESFREQLSYVHNYVLPNDSVPSTVIKLLEDSFEVIRIGEITVV